MTAWQEIKRRFSNISVFSAAVFLLICIGWVLRFRQYFQDNSLWLDEAMLALNIIQRDMFSLLQPLDYNQGAPPAFLWAVKTAVQVFGNNEYSLRLIPLLSGCLVLFFIWSLSRKVTAKQGALFAVLMAAFGHSLIFFSVQVKQYSVDAAVTLFLYIFGLKLIAQDINKKQLMMLALAGIAAVWISHTVIFTLPALALVLIFSHWRAGGWKGIRQFMPVLAAWLVNFICLYFLLYSSLNANQYLMDYWREYFLPITWSAPFWVFGTLGGLFYSPGELAFSGPQIVIVILFLLGLIRLLFKRSAFGWIFSISLVLTLAASGLGKYPFGGRMVLFLVPGLLICAGEGLSVFAAIFKSKKMVSWTAFFIICVFLAYSPVLVSL
ncbi:MAG: glycosyltransferase family 39 protein, partial [Chloroflexota bacterium]